MPERYITKCPVCKKDVLFYENPYRPFCSKRCKMIDLGAWFKEDYRIETELYDLKTQGNTQEEREQ